MTKRNWTRAILCGVGFVAFAGLHRFYDGEIIWGCIYFATGGIFLFGTIFDLYRIISGDYKKE